MNFHEIRKSISSHYVQECGSCICLSTHDKGEIRLAESDPKAKRVRKVLEDNRGGLVQEQDIDNWLHHIKTTSVDNVRGWFWNGQDISGEEEVVIMEQRGEYNEYSAANYLHYELNFRIPTLPDKAANKLLEFLCGPPRLFLLQGYPNWTFSVGSSQISQKAYPNVRLTEGWVDGFPYLFWVSLPGVKIQKGDEILWDLSQRANGVRWNSYVVESRLRQEFLLLSHLSFLKCQGAPSSIVTSFASSQLELKNNGPATYSLSLKANHVQKFLSQLAAVSLTSPSNGKQQKNSTRFPELTDERDTELLPESKPVAIKKATSKNSSSDSSNIAVDEPIVEKKAAKKAPKAKAVPQRSSSSSDSSSFSSGSSSETNFKYSEDEVETKSVKRSTTAAKSTATGKRKAGAPATAKAKASSSKAAKASTASAKEKTVEPSTDAIKSAITSKEQAKEDSSTRKTSTTLSNAPVTEKTARISTEELASGNAAETTSIPKKKTSRTVSPVQSTDSEDISKSERATRAPSKTILTRAAKMRSSTMGLRNANRDSDSAPPLRIARKMHSAVAKKNSSNHIIITDTDTNEEYAFVSCANACAYFNFPRLVLNQFSAFIHSAKIYRGYSFRYADIIDDCKYYDDASPLSSKRRHSKGNTATADERSEEEQPASAVNNSDEKKGTGIDTATSGDTAMEGEGERKEAMQDEEGEKRGRAVSDDSMRGDKLARKKKKRLIFDEYDKEKESSNSPVKKRPPPISVNTPLAAAASAPLLVPDARKTPTSKSVEESIYADKIRELKERVEAEIREKELRRQKNAESEECSLNKFLNNIGVKKEWTNDASEQNSQCIASGDAITSSSVPNGIINPVGQETHSFGNESTNTLPLNHGSPIVFPSQPSVKSDLTSCPPAIVLIKGKDDMSEIHDKMSKSRTQPTSSKGSSDTANGKVTTSPTIGISPTNLNMDSIVSLDHNHPNSDKNSISNEGAAVYSNGPLRSISGATRTSSTANSNIGVTGTIPVTPTGNGKTQNKVGDKVKFASNISGQSISGKSNTVNNVTVTNNKQSSNSNSNKESGVLKPSSKTLKCSTDGLSVNEVNSIAASSNSFHPRQVSTVSVNSREIPSSQPIHSLNNGKNNSVNVSNIITIKEESAEIRNRTDNPVASIANVLSGDSGNKSSSNPLRARIAPPVSSFLPSKYSNSSSNDNPLNISTAMPSTNGDIDDRKDERRGEERRGDERRGDERREEERRGEERRGDERRCEERRNDERREERREERRGDEKRVDSKRNEDKRQEERGTEERKRVNLSVAVDASPIKVSPRKVTPTANSNTTVQGARTVSTIPVAMKSPSFLPVPSIRLEERLDSSNNTNDCEAVVEENNYDCSKPWLSERRSEASKPWVTSERHRDAKSPWEVNSYYSNDGHWTDSRREAWSNGGGLDVRKETMDDSEKLTEAKHSHDWYINNTSWNAKESYNLTRDQGNEHSKGVVKYQQKKPYPSYHYQSHYESTNKTYKFGNSSNYNSSNGNSPQNIHVINNNNNGGLTRSTSNPVANPDSGMCRSNNNASVGHYNNGSVASSDSPISTYGNNNNYDNFSMQPGPVYPNQSFNRSSDRSNHPPNSSTISYLSKIESETASRLQDRMETRSKMMKSFSYRRR